MNRILLDLKRRFNFFFRGFRKYEIWEEGYLVTGQHATARYLGYGFGRNFKEACWDFVENHPNAKLHFINPDTAMGSYCCKIFDNEADARKSFG